MKKRNGIILAGIIVVGGVTGIGIAASGGNDGDYSPPSHSTTQEPTPEPADPATPTPEPTPKPTPPPKPSGPATSFSDGTYKVGSDVKSGTYKTDGASDMDLGCYWERDTSDTGEFDDIITNNFVNGPDRVTVSAGEFLKVSGGCEWKLVA